MDPKNEARSSARRKLSHMGYHVAVYGGRLRQNRKIPVMTMIGEEAPAEEPEEAPASEPEGETVAETASSDGTEENPSPADAESDTPVPEATEPEAPEDKRTDNE